MKRSHFKWKYNPEPQTLQLLSVRYGRGDVFIKYSDLDGSDNHQTIKLNVHQRPDVQLNHFCLMVTGTRTYINAPILNLAAWSGGPQSSGDRTSLSACSIPTQVWPGLLKVLRDVSGPFQQLSSFSSYSDPSEWITAEHPVPAARHRIHLIFPGLSSEQHP